MPVVADVGADVLLHALVGTVLEPVEGQAIPDDRCAQSLGLLERVGARDRQLPVDFQPSW